MRFGLDARLALYDRGGLGRYIRCLASSLRRECAPDATSVICDFRDGGWNSNAHGVFGPVRSSWLDWIFMLQTKILRLNLIHYPDHVIPRFAAGRCVVTVHDVSFWRMPETHSPISRAYYEGCREAVLRADAVICVSDFTRDELLLHTDAMPEKVFTVPNGLDPAFVPASQDAITRVKNKYGLSNRPFVLFVGTIGRRKNLVRLVDAFASSKLLEGFDLVLAGKWGDATVAVRGAIVRCGIVERVKLLGITQEEDLPSLISAAQILVMTSLYEGFGLPVLEAMGCGTLAVISNRRPLVDVAGGAAIAVEPTDVASICKGLEQGIADSALRNYAVQRGLQIAKSFDWQIAARQTLEIYRRAAR